MEEEKLIFLIMKEIKFIPKKDKEDKEERDWREERDSTPPVENDHPGAPPIKQN